MNEILFVGTERVGCHVPEVSGKTVQYTGEKLHLADVKDLVLKENYQCVIFDLSMFVDHYEQLATDIESLSHVSNARFIFYYLGKNKKSALISTLMDKGFYLFVTDSIAARANDELKKCLDGYATLEPDTALPEESAPIEPPLEVKQTLISVAGCCSRMGTTTQAIQIVKYLQYLGHNACYIQMNSSAYVESVQRFFSVTETDNDVARVTYAGVDMFAKPEYISRIRDLDYTYFVFDYGSINAPGFNTISFIERDIRVVVGGDSPSELVAMNAVFNSALLRNDVFYIFNFIHDSEKKEILELMMDKSERTYFAAYTPDPFVYSTDNNAVFDAILHAPNISTKKKKTVFPFFGKIKS